MSANQHLRELLAHRVPVEEQRHITEVLDLRTRFLTVVVEDLYQPHNAAAAIRACECFGIQDLHAIATRQSWRVSEEVVAGADQWVDVHTWDKPAAENTLVCLEMLKQRGFSILATSLRPGCIPLSEVPLDRPTALCFGTEKLGLSDLAHDLADGFVRIPMYGFTQSFNISVSTALSLSALSNRLRSSDQPWRLLPKDRHDLELRWLIRISGLDQAALEQLAAQADYPLTEHHLAALKKSV